MSTEQCLPTLILVLGKKAKLFWGFHSLQSVAAAGQTERQRAIFWGQQSCSHGRGGESSVLHCGGSHRNEQTEFLLFFSEGRQAAKSEIAETKAMMVFSVDHSAGLALVLPSLSPSVPSLPSVRHPPIQIMHLATRFASHRPFLGPFCECE